MYWACAQLQPNRTAVALRFLVLHGFEIYAPRIRERRLVRGCRVEASSPLFVGYAFVWIALGWWEARWSPGVTRLIMDGIQPARVSDSVIAEIRARECNGLVELPSRLRRGDRVKVRSGPFRDQLGLYAGQAPHERVAVLLTLLGSPRRIELPEDAVEAVGDHQ